MILGKKFVIDDLDETHLFVSAEIVPILQEKVWEIMDNNSFNVSQANWRWLNRYDELQWTFKSLLQSWEQVSFLANLRWSTWSVSEILIIQSKPSVSTHEYSKSNDASIAQEGHIMLPSNFGLKTAGSVRLEGGILPSTDTKSLVPLTG